ERPGERSLLVHDVDEVVGEAPEGVAGEVRGNGAPTCPRLDAVPADRDRPASVEDGLVVLAACTRLPGRRAPQNGAAAPVFRLDDGERLLQVGQPPDGFSRLGRYARELPV